MGTNSAIVVKVDEGRCMGARACLRAAPQTFDWDPAGIARARANPVDELGTILEAARSCPNFAVTVEADGRVVYDPDRS